MEKRLELPGQTVVGDVWPTDVVAMLEADFTRFAELWARLDIALTTEPQQGSVAEGELRDKLAAHAHDLAATYLRAATDHMVTWRQIYLLGFRPSFAHLSLLRVAHESAFFAYWLLEPGIDANTRLARGVASQADDYKERAKLEVAMGSPTMVPPAKSAADRLADLMTEAAQRNLTRLNKNGGVILQLESVSAIMLFDDYEKPVPKDTVGSYLYRLYSGYTHGKQWAGTQNAKAAAPLDAQGRTLAVVMTDPVPALVGTRRATNAIEMAINAFVAARMA